MSPANRCAFFDRIIVLASLQAGTRIATKSSSPAGYRVQRGQAALQIPSKAALAQSVRPTANHRSSGDQTKVPNYIAGSTKGLPHTNAGEVEPDAYETLSSLSTGRQADFEAIDRSSGMKLVHPQSAFTFQMETPIPTPGVARPLLASAVRMPQVRWSRFIGKRWRGMCPLPILTPPLLRRWPCKT